jgi:phage terminase large subunit-like protein
MPLSDRELAEAEMLRVAIRREQTYKFRRFYPDCLPGCQPNSVQAVDHVVRPDFQTPICRALYPWALEFFAAGRLFEERACVAANRVGKTVMAAYEMTAHVTGDYPAWWPGRRFDGPISAWACGDTRETTRDIVQQSLFGPREEIQAGRFETGMVPSHLVLDSRMKPGVADCLDMVWVRHRTGKTSKIQFKAYDQGRLAFQGATLDLIWLDEEPPSDPNGGDAETTGGSSGIYTECLLRTMTTGGLILSTFTPLRGLTPFLDHLLGRSMMRGADSRLINAKLAIFSPR